MKKFIIVISIIIIVLCFGKNDSLEKETIRFRIIANSDSEEDQSIKKEVLKEIAPYLLNNNSNNINLEREKIKKELPIYEEIIKKKTDNYTINYGNNYFPKKTYQGKTYEEGKYESLLITIGEGKGKNFWCILFPPLCMIDEEEQEKIEYKSYIKEVINKYF